MTEGKDTPLLDPSFRLERLRLRTVTDMWSWSQSQHSPCISLDNLILSALPRGLMVPRVKIFSEINQGNVGRLPLLLQLPGCENHDTMLPIL